MLVATLNVMHLHVAEFVRDQQCVQDMVLIRSMKVNSC